jgi:hypothetical protein
MAKQFLGFLCPNRRKHREPHFISVFVFVITTVNFVLSQTSVADCILNIQSSSSSNSSSCEASNWGGFINSCCGVVFDEYLHGLGWLANKTGQIYLNPTEQRNCLTSKKSIDENISACGIEKLTSGGGAGGCSDYTVTDVIGKLGNRMKNLGEDCGLLGLDGTSGQACSECFRRWEEIGTASDNGRNLMKVEANVCRFAVLVTLTSSRIDDDKWVRAVYDCLGGQGHLSLGEVLNVFFVNLFMQPNSISFLLLYSHPSCSTLPDLFLFPLQMKREAHLVMLSREAHLVMISSPAQVTFHLQKSTVPCLILSFLRFINMESFS